MTRKVPGRTLSGYDGLGPMNEQTLEAASLTDCIRFDRFTVDLCNRVLLGFSGQEIPLTRSEFDLLSALLVVAPQPLSRDHLLDAVSQRRLQPFDRSVDMLVGRLRRKIEPDPKNPRFILAVRGFGYKFAVGSQVWRSGN